MKLLLKHLSMTLLASLALTGLPLANAQNVAGSSFKVEYEKYKLEKYYKLQMGQLGSRYRISQNTGGAGLQN